MSRGELTPETLRDIDESVFRLADLCPNTTKHSNIGSSKGAYIPEFTRDSTYTYSEYMDLSLIGIPDSMLKMYRSSQDLWIINLGIGSHWHRKPDEPFLVGSETKHTESVLGEDRGRRLLGILESLLHINEPNNY